jgi:PKD repeat protein
MKKLFPLLLFILTVFSFTSQAQSGNTCNADFNFQYINTNTVKFTPVVIGDSLNTFHYWYFGDGNISSIALPTHAYAANGSYTVKHFTYKINPNGIEVCRDSVTKQIVIQGACTLVANFYSFPDSTGLLKIQFINTSAPLDPTDSIRWTFGDGTSSSAINPSHTYANYGTYTVCLRVKKNNFPAGSTPCISEICKVDTITSCNLTANFFSSVSQSNYLTHYFTQTTSPLSQTDSVSWSFGDGSFINGLQNNPAIAHPVHTYSQPGVYNVCLRIKKNNLFPGTVPCVSEICYHDTVVFNCIIPYVNFTSTADPSNSLIHKFSQIILQTSAADSLYWKFGDGSTLAGLQGNAAIANPIHSFVNAGVYNVCLKIKRNNTPAGSPACINEICHLDTVSTNSCNLTANFSWSSVASNPLTIAFQNSSIPLSSTDSVRWVFGDGTSSLTVNPTHTYQQPGIYTVCLRVQKNNGAGSTPCVKEICKTIIVQLPCNIQVNFSIRRDSINTRKIYFTNLTGVITTNATAKWNFGDGTSSTSWNAVHEYAQPGMYRVCLIVQTDSNCVREKCDTVVISQISPACKDLSKYKFEKFSNDNQKYKFTPDFIGTDIQYTWTFGDGTGSHDPVATHRYAQPGVYIACLTAWRGPNCASTTCKEIKVLSQINCDSIRVTYTYQKDPFLANKIYFYMNANFIVLDQTWTISKLSPSSTPPVILHQNNPSYIFTDTGYYRVCLKAVTLGGCVKEYCSVVRIENIAPLCILQVYPNPASNQINVAVQLTQPEIIHAYVYNTLNVLVKEKNQQGVAGNNAVAININDLVPGLYTIKVMYGGKTCYARFNKL